MKNVSDKSFRQIKSHILCTIICFRKFHRSRDSVEKILAESGRPQMTI